MDSGMTQDDSVNASATSAPEKDAELYSTLENSVLNVPLTQGSLRENRPHLEKQRKQNSPLSNGQSPITKISDTTAIFVTEKRSSSCRKSLVNGVSQWNFPLGILDKSKFVFDSLRQGFDAKVVRSTIASLTLPTSQQRQTRNSRKRKIHYNEKALEDNVIGAEEKDKRPPFGSPRSRRRTNEDPTYETKIKPKAAGVEFDTRFLSFELAPDGSFMVEKLVWSIENTRNNISYDSREASLEKIPDLPKQCSESFSRVGPMYQARIPKRLKLGNSIPCCWDKPPG
jgi:hypothetical protein